MPELHFLRWYSYCLSCGATFLALHCFAGDWLRTTLGALTFCLLCSAYFSAFLMRKAGKGGL